jgi:hypothetical protein
VEEFMTELYSILVTTTGRPLIGSRHVIRYAERFWVARVASGRRLVRRAQCRRRIWTTPCARKRP